MKKDFSRKEIECLLNEFVESSGKNKNSDDIKRLKKLSMSKNIKFKKARKLFCKKCSAVYCNPKIRIKKGMKTVTCEKCGFVNRWNIK